MIAVLLADGFEEIEAITTIDFLRRCGLEVKVIAIDGKNVYRQDTSVSSSLQNMFPPTNLNNVVKGAHGIFVLCDLVRKGLESVPWEQFDCVILPGGMPGTKNLEASEIVQKALKSAYQNNKLIAAICAAPSILAHLHMLKGKNATCFPGFEDELIAGGATHKSDFVVEYGNIITAKGAGCTIDFAQAIAARFVGQDKAREVRESLQIPYVL